MRRPATSAALHGFTQRILEVLNRRAVEPEEHAIGLDALSLFLTTSAVRGRGGALLDDRSQLAGRRHGPPIGGSPALAPCGQVRPTGTQRSLVQIQAQQPIERSR